MAYNNNQGVVNDKRYGNYNNNNGTSGNAGSGYYGMSAGGGNGIVSNNSNQSFEDRSANTQNYLNDYNANREQKIRDMYSQSNNANLAALKSGYDQSVSAAMQYRDNISPQYQESMNQLSSEYERQRRNNNMQFASNGLNTGAGSQMALGQMNAYQQGQGRLATSENEAINAANQNIRDLKTNYQNQIAQATANNDYQLAAALLDEYGQQYDRTMNQAKQLAEFGDFSLYANIYGVEAAQQMEKMWSFQNPDLAFNLGKITEEEYFNITGRYPRGHGHGGGYGGGGYYNSNSSSSYGLQKRYEDNMAKAKQFGQLAAVTGTGGRYVPKDFDAGNYGGVNIYGVPSGSNPSNGTSKDVSRVALKSYNSNSQR